MGANTTYYALIPKLKYEWVEVSAVTASDVWEDYPSAQQVLHWTEFDENTERKKDGQ